jgi:hypothetical protein
MVFWVLTTCCPVGGYPRFGGRWRKRKKPYVVISKRTTICTSKVARTTNLRCMSLMSWKVSSQNWHLSKTVTVLWALYLTAVSMLSQSSRFNIFSPEDRDSMLLRNVRVYLRAFTASTQNNNTVSVEVKWNICRQTRFSLCDGGCMHKLSTIWNHEQYQVNWKVFSLQAGINEYIFITKGGDKTTQRSDTRYGKCILLSGNRISEGNAFLVLIQFLMSDVRCVIFLNLAVFLHVVPRSLVDTDRRVRRAVLPPLPDDVGSKLLWDASHCLPDYTTQHPRRQTSSYFWP